MVPRYGRPFTRTGALGLGDEISNTSAGAVEAPPGASTATPVPCTATRHTSPAGISASRAPDGSLTLSPSTLDTEAAPAPTTRPTRMLGSTGPCPAGTGASVGASGPGTGVGPGGAGVGVQLATATAAAAASVTPTAVQRRSRARALPASAAIIAKLELDAEVLTTEQRDDGLQLVPGRAGHPDLVPLNRRLRLLEATVLDGLDDLLPHVLRDALGELDRAPDRLPGRGHHLTEIEILHRNPTLDHSGLEDVHQRLHPELVVGREAD